MHKLSTRFLFNLFFMPLLTLPLLLMAGDAEQKAVNQLLDVTKFEKMMDESMKASLQMLKQSNLVQGENEAVLETFLKKYMSGASLRQDVVAIYSEMFTVAELNEMTAFYKTKTGQKALEKMPEIMRRTIELSQTRVMQHLPELQEMIMEEDQKTH